MPYGNSGFAQTSLGTGLRFKRGHAHGSHGRSNPPPTEYFALVSSLRQDNCMIFVIMRLELARFDAGSFYVLQQPSREDVVSRYSLFDVRPVS